MPAGDPEAVMRQYFETVNQAFKTGDLSGIDPLFAPTYVEHLRGMGLPPNVEGLKMLVQVLHQASPDLNASVEDVVTQGEKVVVRHRHRGTLTGDFMGIPGRGQTYDFPGVEIARVEDGRIVESWHVDDLLTFMQQVGAVPAPGQ